MKLLSYNLPDDHNIFFFGDVHSGSVLSYDHGWDVLIGMMLSEYEGCKNNYGVDGVDQVEAITVDDKRFSLEKMNEPLPGQQIDAAISKRQPIKDKLLALLQGNHELKLWKYANVSEKIADSLGVPYGTYTIKLTIKDSRGHLMYKIFETHGHRSINSSADDLIRRQANMELILKRHLKFKSGDCAVMIKHHCFSDDTEILTKDGWKKYNQITLSDIALTFNMTTQSSEWQKLENIYIYKDQVDDLYNFKGRGIDFCITGEHRIITLKNQGKKWGDRLAKDVFNRSSLILPIAAKSNLPDYPISDDFIKLIGWIVSEGEYMPHGPIRIHQGLKKSVLISSILDKLNITYSKKLRKNKGNIFADPRTGKNYICKQDLNCFYIGAKEAKKIKNILPSKNIPKLAFEFSDRQFDLLLNSLVLGDGHFNKGKNSGYYATTSELIADTLQSLCLTHGWRCMKSINSNPYNIGKQGYHIHFCRRSTKVLFKVSSQSKVVPSSKITWCVSVPNGTLFTRRNGKAVILGNSHKLIVSKPKRELYLYDDGEHINQSYTIPGQKESYIDPDRRWYGCAGSFLRIYGENMSGYAEIAEYDPVELGFLVLMVRSKKIVDLRPIYIGI